LDWVPIKQATGSFSFNQRGPFAYPSKQRVRSDAPSNQRVPLIKT